MKDDQDPERQSVDASDDCEKACCYSKDPCHLEDDLPGLRSCSTTTLSTTSDTSSQDSFLPSFSHDSDASRDEETQLHQVSFSPADLLRHRRASDPPNASVPRQLPYTPPLATRFLPYQPEAEHAKAETRPLYRLIRLVLVLGLSFVLVAQCLEQVALGQNPHLRWRIPVSRRHVLKAMKRIPQHDVSRTFSIVLSGRRLDLLQASLDQHAYCQAVEAVRIEWQGADEQDVPDWLLQHSSGKVQDDTETPFSSSAVLLLDESLAFSCAELTRAFYEWRRDPVRVVGLLPATDGIVSLVSDAAVFVHKSFVPAQPRATAVEEPCRDFVLSAFLAQATARATVPMMSKPKRLVSSEVTTGQETHCVSQLARSFGLSPKPTQPVFHHYVGQ